MIVDLKPAPRCIGQALYNYRRVLLATEERKLIPSELGTLLTAMRQLEKSWDDVTADRGRLREEKRLKAIIGAVHLSDVQTRSPRLAAASAAMVELAALAAQSPDLIDLRIPPRPRFKLGDAVYVLGHDGRYEREGR